VAARPPASCLAGSRSSHVRQAKALRKEKFVDSNDVLLSRSGGVLRITINRPQRRNALTESVFRIITEALIAAPKDGETQVIVITGAGDKAFCAGADLTPS